jgi:hypothetical protein
MWVAATYDALGRAGPGSERPRSLKRRVPRAAVSSDSTTNRQGEWGGESGYGRCSTNSTCELTPKRLKIFDK